MDEYAGLPPSHSASFQRYMRERVAAHVPLRAFHYLDGTNDPGLQSFIRAYRVGPQTPEPGAACTGGTAATQ